MNWDQVEVPVGLPPPAPLTVRVESLAARSAFPEHRHEWAQVVYAISGVLTVAIARRSFVISPEQGVWLPTGISHRVGTLLGAEFPALLFAQADVTRAGVETLAMELARRAVPIVIAGARAASAESLGGAGATVLPTLEVRSEIAPILLVQSAYRVIAELSVRRGFDPDRPAHLRKVTETV